jgi:hypothetical protein
MKIITHVYAIIAAAVGAFLLTPAGVAVLMQYPRLASLLALATVLGVYHQPVKASAIAPTLKVLAPILLALSLATASAHAQTAPVTIPEGTQSITIGASYSSTSGTLDNGTVETIQKRIWKYGSVRLDAFTLGPFLSTVARFQPQASLSHVFKANPYFNPKPILPFVNAGGGVAKSADGTTKAAFAVGAGCDYYVNKSLMLRVLDFTYLRSTIYPGGSEILTNFKSVATGLTLNF